MRSNLFPGCGITGSFLGIMMFASACGGELPEETRETNSAATSSAKATASVGDIAILNATDLDWSTVMAGELKDVNGDGTILASECEFTDEEISLLIGTMNANAFNFVSDVLSSGVHSIEVQAKISASTEFQTGSAEATGSVGKGSVIVTSERFARGDTITFVGSESGVRGR